mmetsp:Transcript_5251/g.12538  ORF Transcript_5251/g.12538 Transcript_5251/m.12538 type:complete len:225 (+) Transcript_5251:1033-1707(+)
MAADLQMRFWPNPKRTLSNGNRSRPWSRGSGSTMKSFIISISCLQDEMKKCAVTILPERGAISSNHSSLPRSSTKDTEIQPLKENTSTRMSSDGPRKFLERTFSSWTRLSSPSIKGKCIGCAASSTCKRSGFKYTIPWDLEVATTCSVSSSMYKMNTRTRRSVHCRILTNGNWLVRRRIHHDNEMGSIVEFSLACLLISCRKTALWSFRRSTSPNAENELSWQL